MTGLNNLKPQAGSRHRRKIVGRGEGSGHGGSATRGMKGQKSRSGDTKMTGFEGGQMPLIRRIPKRGFTNKFRKEFEIVNIGKLSENFKTGAEIDLKVLKEKGLIKKDGLLKVLGDGEIKKSLNVKANAFSKSAIEKIEAAGGKVEILK
ncbi:50S ribosomal protein L15 [Elusimicrobiota bacterium]